MRRTLVMVVLAGAFLGAMSLPARELVVNQKHPAADDTNAGTADKPFKTISAAVAKVAPGDTVLIKAGLYREAVEVKASGTMEKRITVKAAPGERVVISGSDPVTGWRKATKEECRGSATWDRIWVAEVKGGIEALFQDEEQLRLSRWPKQAKSKYPAEGGDSLRVVDAKRLTQPAGFWEGGLLTVRDASTTNYNSAVITGYDPAKHELVVGKARPVDVEGGKDEYYVKNLVTLITEPGEFAVVAQQDAVRVYVWPVGGKDPNACLMETPRREGANQRLVSWADGAGYITLAGLEVCHSTACGIGADGSDKARGHHVEVINCISHHNSSTGLYFSYQADMTVRHCIVGRNSHHGISLGFSSNCAIEENEVAYNGVDGIVVGWYSNGNRIARNYSHGQWSLNHPDGFQTFAGVKDFLVEDNLFLNNGQCWQCANTGPGKVTGNMWVGARGGCLNLTPRAMTTSKGVVFPPNAGLELANNTLVFNGSDNMTILATFNVHDNIFGGGYRDPKGGFKVDNNLYHGQRADRALEDYRKTGVDASSKAGTPKFRNAPAGCHGIDDKKFAECTPSKLFLLGAGGFAVGDTVEVNWDGKARKVTETGAGYVVIDPPLKGLNAFGWDVVCNWKKSTDFALDLRLADDSPGKGMAPGGKDVGSSIDIPAYLKGDFNGDGKRDLPPAVKALEYETHTPDE